MSKKIVFTENAPRPIGPYSQAVRVGNFLFGSGQIPINPKTGEVVKGDIKVQTRQVMENIRRILEAEGFSIDDLVMVFVFLKDLRLYSDFNEVYAEFFKEGSYPARVTVEVSRLPKDVLIEVGFIAFKG